MATGDQRLTGRSLTAHDGLAMAGYHHVLLLPWGSWAPASFLETGARLGLGNKRSALRSTYVTRAEVGTVSITDLDYIA